jgi:hypothetical protein
MKSNLTWNEKFEHANNAEELLNDRMTMLSETGKFVVIYIFKKLEIKLEEIYSLQFDIKKYQQQLHEIELKLRKHVYAYCTAVFFLWLLHQLFKVDNEFNIHIIALGVLLALPIVIHFLKIIIEISNIKNTIKKATEKQETMTILIDVEFGEFNINDFIKDNIEEITKNDGIPLKKCIEEHMGKEMIANIKHRIAEAIWLKGYH